MLRKLRFKQKNGFLIKKTHYMKKNPTKNRVVLVKTNRVSKTGFLCKNCVIHKINIKPRLKNFIPSLF